MPYQHGSRSTYRNHHCRCDACRESNTIYQRAYVKRPTDPATWVHGMRYTYNTRGCRCTECKRANREYMQQPHMRAYGQQYGREKKLRLKAIVPQ